VTDLLRYPVLALSPSGVDVYLTETDLVTCHRRAVKSTYEKLRLIDMDRDCVNVVRYRVHPLPPRRLENGRLNNDNVRIEAVLSEPERLTMAEIRAEVVESLRQAGGEEFDETAPTVQKVLGAKGVKDLAQIVTAFDE
jgi:hypothetical protein